MNDTHNPNLGLGRLRTSVSKLVLLYGACTVAFFAIDFAWLSTMNSRFYQPQLGGLLAEQPKLAVAAGFYLLYVIGIVALAVVVVEDLRGQIADFLANLETGLVTLLGLGQPEPVRDASSERLDALRREVLRLHDHVLAVVQAPVPREDREPELLGA
ncbi:MAG: DUF2177 family protein, partial [Actinobacteria bacterium]|nr:DUF2177 family protein [Actinomycetota bacterium]